MRPVVITNCTNRKLRTPVPELCARNLKAQTAHDAARAWANELASTSSEKVALSDLYCGRGFRDAECAARFLEGPLLIVSAGLGLVSASTRAPSYSLTLTRKSEDGVLNKINVSAQTWWGVLNAESPFASDLEDQGGLILAALSMPYLRMVADDWACWPAERLDRLRLFVKGPPEGLPVSLQNCWMPYDDRLDLHAGYAGSQGDYAQRAMKHFAHNFGSRPGDVKAHSACVAVALSGSAQPIRPNRERKSDDELVDLILQSWDQVGGRSGEMLLHLRRRQNIACEQGRFKNLFKLAATQRGGALL